MLRHGSALIFKARLSGLETLAAPVGPYKAGRGACAFRAPCVLFRLQAVSPDILRPCGPHTALPEMPTVDALLIHASLLTPHTSSGPERI
jgi:hypothetical protein